MSEEEQAGLPEGQELGVEESNVDAAGFAKVDLNRATAEELRQLPGIGPTLAARIVDYRAELGPFGHPAEISGVSGISEAAYSRMADRLSVSAIEPVLPPEPETVLLEPEAPEEVPVLEMGPEAEDVDWMVPEPELVEAEEPEDETVVAEAPEPEPERVAEPPPRGPEPPLVEVVQARGGCGRLILVGLLSAILGAALALLLIFLVNGTLDFQATAIRAAQDEVLRMEGVVGALDQQIEDLEGRFEALQELDALVTETRTGLRTLSADLDGVNSTVESLVETQGAIRQEFANLRGDLDGMGSHVNVLDRRLSEAERQIGSLNETVEGLSESIRRFDAFLAGLQALLNDVQGVLIPTPTPWITPAVTPQETPIPRPQVTVIPLPTATPPLP